jgi:CubicO group peptidase (beta-lactamase class C family)
MLKNLLRGLAIVCFLALAGVLIAFWRSPYHQTALPTVTGITAKQLCSMHFLSNLEPERALDIYLKPALDWAAGLVRGEVDRTNRSASASVYGLYRQTAFYREGLGCTLEHDGLLDRNLIMPMDVNNRPLYAADAAAYDNTAIDAALTRAFSEPEGANRNTLAVVVLHRGDIIAERYAAGITETTPLLGWSMAKSATTTLAGAMALRGEVDIRAPGAVPLPAVREITLEHLLRMTSGLAIDEINDGTDPNSEMLWNSADMAQFAATRYQRHAPGEVFDYMSGSTNLAMRHLQDRLGEDLTRQIKAIRERLFVPLGMASALIEPDTAGNLVGSSYMWASARDWAKLGQLYLDDGKVDGQRILSPEWIEAVARQTPQSRDYGMGFWLYRRSEDLPAVFEMNGFQGQSVVIIPSHSLIVVRLGATNRTSSGIAQLVHDMVEIAGSAHSASTVAEKGLLSD